MDIYLSRIFQIKAIKDELVFENVQFVRALIHTFL